MIWVKCRQADIDDKLVDYISQLPADTFTIEWRSGTFDIIFETEEQAVVFLLQYKGEIVSRNFK